ncbi:proline dehydrogenase family protein [Staphylococcus sp. ACRSN]|uniref:proline dehydrogenase family protein n=1 Tax=Staphylococcus sp. ACRSN TaxID=2918214 RepID=UPI001EF24BC7|nr:proline dehydrogenase family protein [Staphylococcus sp. ACRSN]MCG7340410.1 proline dehydrogenase family protein [Staphylococcus sp. ACRSN]
MTVIKSCLFSLSQNSNINKIANKMGPKIGIRSFIAGTNLSELETNVSHLNENNIAVTIDNLGEFVYFEDEARKATTNIIKVIEKINEKNLNGHISLKLTQIGLDISLELCEKHLIEILQCAYESKVFINIDMEDYQHLDSSWQIIRACKSQYSNFGTVIQAALFRTDKDINCNKDMRLRIVKGAYKENSNVAFQSSKDIDKHYLKLCKAHLMNGKFTSIATHDHNIINELIKYIEDNRIDKNKFEFQMLYGFRTNLQESLVKQGFQVCVYMPYGKDWYGYFMRRLAERPQNINLVIKQSLSKLFIKANV